MTRHLKIGLIQNAPLTADFPQNLRTIVQGYRECLDHGAQLVVAPATALCGPNPGALAKRRSFLRQTQAALEALSHELGDAPLLLGAYAPLFPEGDAEWDALAADGGLDGTFGSLGESEFAELVPFLLERDTVTELPDAGVTELDCCRAYVDIGCEETVPNEGDFDLMVHLDDSCWHSDAARSQEEGLLWEARTNGTPVVCAHAVGTAGGLLYGGGSGVYSPAGVLNRLPFFEVSSGVADLGGKPHARALPRADELLEQALQRGIRDSVKASGYEGACLPLDHANSALLAALAADSLGAGNVCGVSFGGENAAAIAKALGIALCELDAAPLLAAAKAEAGSPLAARLCAALLCHEAEERGLMPLSPLCRHELMLGAFTLYGESCGLLAPLGTLYRMDVHLLTTLAGERHPGLTGTLAEPQKPEQDRIIHELADRNISASELLADKPGIFAENEVRFVQRRIIASAAKREQCPVALQVDAPEERHRFPVWHRLND